MRAVRTHGGFGFAKEYHVERGLRESVLSLLAPVTQELALCFVAEQALGLPSRMTGANEVGGIQARPGHAPWPDRIRLRPCGR